MKYCYECGTKLTLKNIPAEGELPYCPSCQKVYFPIFNTTILAAVLNADKTKVCLLKQNYVHSDFMVLVAGYIKKEETAEECVNREIKEELGLSVDSISYVSSYYHAKSNALMLGFYATTNEEKLTLQKEEVDQAQWIDINEAEKLLKIGSTGYKHWLNVLNKIEK